MAFVLKTYTVVSHLPIVVTDAGANISYAPGQTFIESSGNLSVQRLLSLGYIVEADGPDAPAPGPGVGSVVVGASSQALKAVLAAGDLAEVGQSIRFELTAGGDSVDLRASQWSYQYVNPTTAAGLLIERNSDGRDLIAIGLDGGGLPSIAVPNDGYIYWTNGSAAGQYTCGVYGNSTGDLQIDGKRFIVRETTGTPITAETDRLIMDAGVWDFGPGTLAFGTTIGTPRVRSTYESWSRDAGWAGVQAGDGLRIDLNGVAEALLIGQDDFDGAGTPVVNLSVPNNATLNWTTDLSGALTFLSGNLLGFIGVYDTGEMFLGGANKTRIASANDAGTVEIAGALLDVGPASLIFGGAIGAPVATFVNSGNFPSALTPPYVGVKLNIGTFGDAFAFTQRGSGVGTEAHMLLPNDGYLQWGETTLGSTYCASLGVFDGGTLQFDGKRLEFSDGSPSPGVYDIRMVIDDGVIDFGPHSVQFGPTLANPDAALQHIASVTHNWGGPWNFAAGLSLIVGDNTKRFNFVQDPDEVPVLEMKEGTYFAWTDSDDINVGSMGVNSTAFNTFDIAGKLINFSVHNGLADGAWQSFDILRLGYDFTNDLPAADLGPTALHFGPAFGDGTNGSIKSGGAKVIQVHSGDPGSGDPFFVFSTTGFAIGPSAPQGSDIRLTLMDLPVPVTLARVSVDLKVVATTNLYTVPAGKRAVILDALVLPTTATAVSTFAVAGVGIAAGEDDIFASQELTGLDTTIERFKFESAGQARVGEATEIIKFGVDTAATGTALVADVYLIGYLI